MIIKTNSLPYKISNIIINKGTEPPSTGIYNNYSPDILGTYLCRQCGLALFRADNKFISSCGWPSFDDEIAGNIKQILDKDKIRTEILCKRCDAHLGHIFHGEHLTAKNTRYCVNSLSLDFIHNNLTVLDTEETILAAGCFWGVEHLLKQQDGVLFTEVGYIGGEEENPDYKLVCSGKTKYVEAVRVIYDPKIISYEQVIKTFFEVHDFTQTDGQGNDRGSQYLSKIFYYNNQQKEQSSKIIKTLENKNYRVATFLEPMSIFWRAEDYHQEYFKHNSSDAICHIRKKIW